MNKVKIMGILLLFVIIIAIGTISYGAVEFKNGDELYFSKNAYEYEKVVVEGSGTSADTINYKAKESQGILFSKGEEVTYVEKVHSYLLDAKSPIVRVKASDGKTYCVKEANLDYLIYKTATSGSKMVLKNKTNAYIQKTSTNGTQWVQDDEIEFSKNKRVTFVGKVDDNLCKIKTDEGEEYVVESRSLRIATQEESKTAEQRAVKKVLEKFRNKSQEDFDNMTMDELKSSSDLLKIAENYGDTGQKEEIKNYKEKVKKAAEKKGFDIDSYTMDPHSDTPTGREEWDKLVGQIEEDDEASGLTGGPDDTTIFHQPDKVGSRDSSEKNLDDVIKDAEDFVESGEGTGMGIVDQSELQKFSGTLYNILLSLGVAAAVIVGAILGIKLMVSGVEEKAEVKGLIIPYVAGCIIIFGGFTIWKLVVEILSGI